ncbi:hypothetical protein FNF29_08219 [Cafeteria roenbergensis]|uniref:Uncharacterized protein n=1 Tax=Cafeteria roenbergensis TaxID=33653 RepID=A0A5A8BZS2_CAFRO|nr:hypothetical protein FNF29_08219 [Cafeteria roenbergensis]|eukprot:KAA0146158.1 hypothetical protein FNF29_08219 [Cafeteria roenbergensis]
MGWLPLPGTSELEAAHCMAELQAWSVEALCEWDGRDASSLAQLVTELVATMSSSHAEFAERVLPGAAAGVKSLSSVAHHVLTVDDGARGSRVVVRSPVAFFTEPEPTVAAGQTRAAVEVTFQAKGAAAAAEGDDGVKVTARIVGPAAMPVTSAIVLPPLLVDDAGGLSGFVAAASKRVLGSWKARREFCKAIATLASGVAAAQEASGAESVAGPGVLAWDAVDWSRVSVPVRAVEGPGAWVPLPPLLCQFAGQAADPARGEDQPALANPGLSADGSREAHYCVQPGAAAGSAARVAAVLTVRLSHAFPAEAPAIELRSIAPSDGSARPGVVSDRDAPIGWSPDGVQPSELAIRVTLHAWTKLLPLLAATPA